MIADQRPHGHDMPPERPHARPPSLLQALKAVGWGLLGIRGRGGHETDIARLNPLLLIAVAVISVAAFVGILLLIIRLTVGGA